MKKPSSGSPGFSPVTSNDKAGNLWIMTVLALIYTTIVAAARIYIKHQMYGLDDILISFSILLHLAQSVAVFIGLGNGIGKFNSITPRETWRASSKAFLTAELLFILALAFAKCSLLALVLRIIGTKTGRSRPVCFILMGLAVIWGFAACLALTVDCQTDSLLTTDNKTACPRQHARWVAITIADILTEVAAWLLMMRITLTVNMSLKRKLQVVLAFSFRLPLLVLSSLHLSYLSTYPVSPEPQFAIIDALLIQQVTIVWSSISATIPNIKNFLKSFSLGMGFPVAFDITGYGSSNTHPLRDLGSRKPKTTGSQGAGTTSTSVSHGPGHESCHEGPSGWRPDEVRHEGSVLHRPNLLSRGREEEDKVSRNGSQEMIIKKEVVWDVTYEGKQ